MGLPNKFIAAAAVCFVIGSTLFFVENHHEAWIALYIGITCAIAAGLVTIVQLYRQGYCQEQTRICFYTTLQLNILVCAIFAFLFCIGYLIVGISDSESDVNNAHAMINVCVYAILFCVCLMDIFWTLLMGMEHTGWRPQHFIVFSLQGFTFAGLMYATVFGESLAPPACLLVAGWLVTFTLWDWIPVPQVIPDPPLEMEKAPAV